MYSITHSDNGDMIFILEEVEDINGIKEKIKENALAWCPADRSVYIFFCGFWHKNGAELYAVEDATGDHLALTNEKLEAREFSPYETALLPEYGYHIAEGYSVTMAGDDASEYTAEVKDEDGNVKAVYINIPHMAGTLEIDASAEADAAKRGRKAAKK